MIVACLNPLLLGFDKLPNHAFCLELSLPGNKLKWDRQLALYQDGIRYQKSASVAKLPTFPGKICLITEPTVHVSRAHNLRINNNGEMFGKQSPSTSYTLL